MKKHDKAAITELLRQSYSLDPGSIEFLVEEAIKINGDVPVEIACRMLAERSLTVIEEDNLKAFIKRAAQSRDTAQRLVKATKKKGRCPLGRRGWLNDAILLPTANVIQKKVREISGYQPSDSVLDLSDVSGSISDMPIFIDRITRFDYSKNKYVEIRLNNFTYAAALSILAEWILANNLVDRYDFIDCSTEMNLYLENIRFYEALKNPEIRISPDPMDWAVGLTRINKDQPTEKVTEKIVDIIQLFINPNPDDRNALIVLISEMIENVHRHAATPVDGFAVAQVYPKKLKMGVTLVDSGMGVRRSFETGNPSVPIDHLRADEDFLREAVKLYSTSKKDRHTGYGLYILAQLIARNRGTFLVSSGGATLIGYQKGNDVTYDTYLHRSWQGTIVSVIIDLNQQLPLSDVYRSMPAIPGYDQDDIFIN